jgi:hypothetical protein
MHRYRVHIVRRTGRFAPLLTVLVDAGSREEALRIAEIHCVGTKGVWAEDVAERRPAVPAVPALSLLVVPDSESARWSDCGVVAHA